MRGRATTMSAADLPNDQVLTLQQVCEWIFNDAISVAALKIEHDRGSLHISKIGRSYVTTVNDLEEMFRKFRIEAPTRYFGAAKIVDRVRLFEEAAATLASLKARQLERKENGSRSERMSSANCTRHRLLSNPVQPGVETPDEDLTAVSLSGLPDDLPLSLKEACKRVFGGNISVASLKAEHQLQISKIGRAYFTTPKDLKAMLEVCRVQAPAYLRSERLKQLESAESLKAAQASLRLTLQKLKKRSPETR